MTAIYARQSIDKKDSLSIDGQINLCKQECFDEEVKQYEDRGFSGKNINRPGFEKMIADVNNGLIDKIVVYRIDRFSRSIVDFGQVWMILQEKGVKFVSVNERFDTSTPIGIAILQIILIFAQLERETIAERVTDNYYQRAGQGVWVGGPAPYGFHIIKMELFGKKMSVLECGDEKAVVAQIFYMYSQDGVSLGEVARSLNEQNIRGINRKTWDSVAISRILHNPAYVMADQDVYIYYKSNNVKIIQGLREFDGHSAGMLVGKRDRAQKKYTELKEHTFSLARHPGLIPSEIWLKCQYKLERNTQLRNTGKGKYTWLSGLLKCRNCGYSLRVVKSRGSLYLSCSGRDNLKVCDYSHTQQLQNIEATVQCEIENILSGCSAKAVRFNPTAELFEKRRKMEENKVKIERLVAVLSEGTEVSAKYITKEIDRLDEENRSLQHSVQKETIEDSFYELYNIDFQKLDFEEKKLVASKMIDRVLVYEEGIEILWKI